MAGQIKKVVVHMTPNTSKNFTEVMLEIYDKYKDTDFFDDMKKKEADISIRLGKFYLELKRDYEAAKYLDKGINNLKNLGVIKS